jgi:hypothetical protein
VPCRDPIGHSDCTHVENGLNVCDTSRGLGECVQCTGEAHEACDAEQFETCDVFARECVPIGPGDRETCEPCTNDRQCASDHSCVPMTFQGQPHGHGGYCLRSADCKPPYASQQIYRETVNGQSVVVCGFSEERTTCEAIRAFENSALCTESEPCPEGGLCASVNNGATERCTIPCGEVAATSNECMDPADGNTYGVACRGQSVLYCGGSP